MLAVAAAGLGVGLLFVVRARARTSKKEKAASQGLVVKYGPAGSSDVRCPSTPAFDHELWSSVLRKYVREGYITGCGVNLVDLEGLAADNALEPYLEKLAAATSVESMHPDEQLAFYINAYNALCMNVAVSFVREHGKLHKLLDIPKLMGLGEDIKVFNMDCGVLAGERVTLNQIEHRIIRARWAEPRAHAALNCSSAHCPNLRRESYEGHRLSKQLDEQCVEWFGSEEKGARLNDDKLHLSPILSWYGGDFGSVTGFLERYAPPKLRAFLASRRGKVVQVEFNVYDWTVYDQQNGQKAKL